MKKLLLIILGVIPLTQPVGSLWIFSVFVFVWLLSPLFKKMVQSVSLPLWFKFCFAGFVASMLTEYFVFQDQQDGLFSQNLAINLFLAIGIYMSLVVIWYFLLKKFKFNLSGIFLIAGIWGIFIENNFAVLLSFNLIAWLYIFLVYGSLVSITASLFLDKFKQFEQRDTNKKYLWAFLAQSIARITGFIWIVAFRAIFDW